MILAVQIVVADRIAVVANLITFDKITEFFNTETRRARIEIGLNS